MSIPERIAGIKQISFYYSSVLAEEQPVEPFFCRFKMPVSKFFWGVTEVINGITCVFYQNLAFACNVCTGEKMILPDPVFRDHNSVHTSTKFFLGYDASNGGVYKLLKLRKVERQDTVLVLVHGENCCSPWQELWLMEFFQHGTFYLKEDCIGLLIAR